MNATPPSGCGDFELSLEMRMQGALPPERTPALEAHLATCAGCQAFAAQALRMQELLRGTQPVLPAQEVLKRVEGMRNEERGRLATVLVGLVLIAGGLWWAMGHVVPALVTGVLVLLLLLPSAHLRGRRLAAEVARAGSERGELLAVYRCGLEGRLRRWGRLRVLLAAFALLQLAGAVLTPPWPEGARLTFGLYFYGMAALCLARLVQLSVWTLPALRRELEELR
jgi:hypothetical protein